ncbi:MAG: hypothetical protein V3S83_12370 [Gemmatimonadota bacterium]
MTKLAVRSLQADPEAVRAYHPLEIDLRIAESLLGGKYFQKDIASDLEVSKTAVREVFADPVRCAWISQQITVIARHRMGMVDAALMNKALAGDVRAMQLYFKRHDQLVDRHHHTISKSGIDLAQYTDDELATIARHYEQKQLREATPVEIEEKPCQDPKSPDSSEKSTS